jgi:2'-5' RNA ligase
MARLFIGTFLQAVERDQIAELPAQCPQLSQLINRKIRWVKPKKLHMTWLFLGEVKEGAIESISQRLEQCVADFRSPGRSGRDARAPWNESTSKPTKDPMSEPGSKPTKDPMSEPGSEPTKDPTSEPGSGLATGTSDLEIQFDKLAFWPNKKEPKNIVLCASQPSEHFTLLASTVRRDLKPFCDSDKEEKFRPHVTLLRVDRHPIEPSVPGSATALAHFIETVADAASQVTPLQLNLERIDLIRSHIGQTSEEYESLSSFATTEF